MGSASTSPSRTIIDDVMVQTWTTLLATSIYGSVLYITYRTFLPSFLVTHFDGLVNLSVVYDASLLVLILPLVPVGYAAREFIFSPSTAAQVAATNVGAKKTAFNAETATLRETFWHNVWGFDTHTKVVLQRTATLVAVVLGNTTLQGTLTVEGVDAVGAAGWASLWAAAGLLTGAVFWWVGDV